MAGARGVILAVILTWAVVSDLRSRRIPNLLTLPGLALGLVLWTVEAGWLGLKTSLLGTLAGGALLFLPFAAGGIGAGDVKLLAVVGAFSGPAVVFRSFLAAAIIGGLGSAVVLWRAGRLGATLKTALWDVVALVSPLVPFVPLPKLPEGQEKREGPSLAGLPYAVAIALGAGVGWLWRVR